MRVLAIASAVTGLLLLAGAGAHAFAADAPAAPDKTDLQACALLASVLPANLPDYLVSSAFVDLDGDGSLERLAIAYEGTADVANFYVTHADGSSADITYSDAYDDPTGSLLGDVRWLVFAGRAYVAMFDGGGAGYLHYLSRIDGSYTERPICSFAPQAKVSLVAVAKQEQAICDALASGKVKFADVQKLQPQSVPMRDLPGGETTIVGKATLDFANTGHPAAVYLLNAESGAGAGCSLAYYDTKPDDRTSAAHKQLMAMQAIELTDAYPRRTCEDADPQWFTVAGVQYLETRAVDAAMPTGEEDEYDTVDVIQHGTPARVCQAIYEHDRPQLRTVWSGTAWVAPPADMPAAPPDPTDPPY